MSCNTWVAIIMRWPVFEGMGHGLSGKWGDVAEGDAK